MTFNPQREEKKIQPLLRNIGFLNFQIFFQNGGCWEYGCFLKKSLQKIKCFSWIRTLCYRNKFAEELTKKSGGHFRDFPRFAYAHCSFVSPLKLCLNNLGPFMQLSSAQLALLDWKWFQSCFLVEFCPLKCPSFEIIKNSWDLMNY